MRSVTHLKLAIDIFKLLAHVFDAYNLQFVLILPF